MAELLAKAIVLKPVGLNSEAKQLGNA